MPRRSIPRPLVAVALTLVLAGCAGTVGTSTTSGAPAATTTTSSTALSATPSAPPYVPVPTFVSTTETTSTAPAGAIPVALTLNADDAPRFQPDTITVKAGTVVFFLHNIPVGARLPNHNMQIGPAGAQFFSDGSLYIGQVLAGTPDIHANETATFTITDLRPGTYLFWCSVQLPDGGNHEAGGMRGTLTVTP
jgi:plastocyanin